MGKVLSKGPKASVRPAKQSRINAAASIPGERRLTAAPAATLDRLFAEELATLDRKIDALAERQDAFLRSLDAPAARR